MQAEGVIGQRESLVVVGEFVHMVQLVGQKETFKERKWGGWSKDGKESHGSRGKCSGSQGGSGGLIGLAGEPRRCREGASLANMVKISLW